MKSFKNHNIAILIPVSKQMLAKIIIINMNWRNTIKDLDKWCTVLEKIETKTYVKLYMIA